MSESLWPAAVPQYFNQLGGLLLYSAPINVKNIVKVLPYIYSDSTTEFFIFKVSDGIELRGGDSARQML